MKRNWAVGVLFFAAVLAAGCGDSPPPRPDIILIVADTLRPDHAGCYGYDRPITPALDSLAADSVVFENAYCDMPLTPSSHASIFTGVPTDVHGVYHRPQEEGGGFYAISPSLATLPEELRRAGYCTGAAVSSSWLGPAFGFGKGFDVYEVHKRRLEYGDLINQRVSALFRQLKEQGDCEHFFFLLHYYDPHSDTGLMDNVYPYYAPPAYVARFAPNAELAVSLTSTARRRGSRYLAWLEKHQELMPPGMLEAIVELYDAGIASYDDSLGRLLDGLRLRGAYDDALIIFVADHGEEFLEHGEFIHNQVYEENIRVPLLIKFPGNLRAGERVAAPVELLDILPTLLDYLELPTPRHLRGRSLIPLVEGEKPEPRLILARQKGPVEARVYSLAEGRWKLVYDLNRDTAELYDLVADPKEKNNLASSRPAEVNRLRRLLLGRIEENLRLKRTLSVDAGSVEFDRARLDELRALGYLQ